MTRSTEKKLYILQSSSNFEYLDYVLAILCRLNAKSFVVLLNLSVKMPYIFLQSSSNLETLEYASDKILVLLQHVISHWVSPILADVFCRCDIFDPGVYGYGLDRILAQVSSNVTST